MGPDFNALNDQAAEEIFKALSNQTRVHILRLLKHPTANFSTQVHVMKENGFEGGVCVSDIRKNIGVSQSTASQYLAILQQSGLLEMKRIGQWTYYRRNEATIKQLEQYIRFKL
ncbi:ArsR/SmtB family transcription factor [Alicyclobacillus fastidiosus]|uniref:Metalloregulator ArsR/SmtB family transcription factor n=1 Tax=Alicyclobacillus fastidiosus TaxID=392011 RepID=A0ABV5AKP1_9BACL